MKKYFLFVILLITSSNLMSEIVTLEDGRKIDLKSDGSYEIISDDSSLSSTQQSIISLFEFSNIDFEYEIPDNVNSIILKNLFWSDDELYQTIDRIEFINLNEDYFKNFNYNSFNQYKGQLFEKIILNNWIIETKDESLGFEYFEISGVDHLKIDKLDLNSFYDNLLLLDGLIIEKVKMNNSFYEKNNEKIKFNALVNNIKNFNIDSFQLSEISFETKEFDAYVEIFSIDDFKLNQKTLYTINWDDPSDSDWIDIIDSIGKYEMLNGEIIYSTNDNLIINFTKLLFQDFEIEYLNDNLFPTNGLIELIGLEINTIYQNNEFYNELNEILGTDNIKFDTIIDWKVNNDDIFIINSSFNLQSFFELNIISEFTNFENIFNYDTGIEDSDIKLNSFTIKLLNNGFIEKIYTLAALEQDISVDQFISNMIFQLDMFSIESYLGFESYNQFISFLENPDYIQININPSPTLSFLQISNLIMNPEILFEILNINIKSNI